MQLWNTQLQEILSNYLEQHDLTYREFAELLSKTYPTTQGAVGHWMTDKWKPSVLRLRAYLESDDESVRGLAKELINVRLLENTAEEDIVNS